MFTPDEWNAIMQPRIWWALSTPPPVRDADMLLLWIVTRQEVPGPHWAIDDRALVEAEWKAAQQ